MSAIHLTPIKGTIQSISSFQDDCCRQLVTLNAEDGIVNFIISPDTFIVNTTLLLPGTKIAGFYNDSLPVPLIYPPVYQAQVITVISENESVMIQRFDRNLLAADSSLRLNPDSSTEILTSNGQYYNCNPGNHTLLVYYTATTRSIPPQTTPSKIIVLC